MCEGARPGCGSRGGGGGGRRLPASRPHPPSRTSSPRFPPRPQPGSAGRVQGSSRPSQVSGPIASLPRCRECGGGSPAPRLPLRSGRVRPNGLGGERGLGPQSEPGCARPPGARGLGRPGVASEPDAMASEAEPGRTWRVCWEGIDDACACDWEDHVGEAAISGVKYGLPVLSGEGGVVTLGMCCANLSPRVWSSLLPLLPSDKFLWYDRGRRMWCSSYSHDVFNSMFSSLRVNFRV